MLRVDQPRVATVETPPNHLSHLDLADWAEERLRSNSYLALKNISCEYLDGVLTLSGCLPSYYLKQIAQETLAPLEGLARIENQIAVVAPGPRPVHRN
jgi:osmotically-inducible protein OsmY